MKHKHHGGPGPVPPANQPHTGPAGTESEQSQDATNGGAGFSEQDPKRRLGDYTTEGEHSFVQPGGRNDSNRKPSDGAYK
jgi:hypothetical protein